MQATAPPNLGIRCDARCGFDSSAVKTAGGRGDDSETGN